MIVLLGVITFLAVLLAALVMGLIVLVRWIRNKLEEKVYKNVSRSEH
jgi:hypothetical protein